MTRKEALNLEAVALENLKRAAIAMVASKSGGYATTRLGQDETPLLARARYIRAGEEWVAASHAVCDAVMAETREERRQYEGTPRDVPVRVHRMLPTDDFE